jgi:peptide/nickel transport system substrate-binding protein
MLASGPLPENQAAMMSPATTSPRRRRRPSCRAVLAAAVAVAAVALAAGGLATAGCHRGPAAPPPLSARPLRVAMRGDPLTLDPHLRNEIVTISVTRNMYEALTAFDAGVRVGPALAESWENPNELTWIFHLRRGVRFHDGHELTARDVLWSFDRARTNPASNVGSYLVAVARVLARDPYTVEITTTRPYPILLNKLAFVCIVAAGSPAEIRRPIGTGPYRLAAYEPGRRLLLRAFDGYWGGAPPERLVELLPVADPRERVDRLLAGEVDLVQDPGPAALERIRAAPGCRVLHRDSLSVAFLLLRRDRPPFADERVRRALQIALDRRALVADALQGEGVPVGQMVSRNVFGFAPAILPAPPDPARARALLAAAGFPGGIDLEVQFRPGRGPEMEAVRRQLLAAGIRVRLAERPWAGLFESILAGDVSFYFGSWVCLSGDASDFFDAMVHSRGGSPPLGYGASNFNHYANRELDAAIEASASTLDVPTRRAELARCMRVVMDDMAFVPLYSPAVVAGARGDVDWQPRRDGLILVAAVRRRAP